MCPNPGIVTCNNAHSRKEVELVSKKVVSLVVICQVMLGNRVHNDHYLF